MTPADRTEAFLIGLLFASLCAVGLIAVLAGCGRTSATEPLPGGVAGEARYRPLPSPQREARPCRSWRCADWTPPPRTALDDCLAFGNCDRDRSPPMKKGTP